LKELNPSITRSIADIKEPDKRKSDHTKTVSVPNSKAAAKLFGNLFELNISNGTFNPLVKADCQYIVDGHIIIDGYCKLKSITQLDNDDIEYNLVLFGSVANIFRELGEKYLNELDLSQWDHPFTREIQDKSWATEVYNSDSAGFVPFAYGTGYVYALADYGLTTDLNLFDIYHVPVSIYAREYMLALFSEAGYSWTSSFLDSNYFKHLVIPSDPASYALTAAEIDAKQFSANTPQFTSTGSTTSNNLPTGTSYSTPDTLIFTNEISDPSGVYNNATGEWTCSNGDFNLTALIDINATFTPSTGVSVVTTSDIEGRIELYADGVIINSQAFYITYDDYPISFSVGPRSTNTSPTYPEEEHTVTTSFSSAATAVQANLIPRNYNPPNRYLVSFQNQNLASGTVLTVKVKARYRGLNGNANHMFEDSSGSGYGGNATLDISVGAFYNKYNNEFPALGDTLKINKVIPKQIKQRDFLKSIINMHNLYVGVDPDNERNLIIEPREDFYTLDSINISEKIAQDREIEIKPVGNLNASEYLYKYKDDGDYYNKKYTENWSRSYGDRIINVLNDFTKTVKKTELIFSPTVSVAPPQKDKILPTIIGLDQNGQATTTKNNIRILYYDGLKPCSEVWRHQETFLNFTDNSTYPYMGHFDDPFNATLDLNFGLVNEVYYDDTTQAINVTNNNLYNLYHKKFIDEITSRDSNIVTAYVYLTPSDYKQWDFRKLYFFENAYFRLQKIEGYNPTSNDLTKCEFLQLKEANVFESQIIGLDGDSTGVTPDTSGTGGSGGVDDTEPKPVKGTKSASHVDGNNTTGRGVNYLGKNNYIAADAYYVDIVGDGNKVYSGASYITLKNSHNNIIDAKVTDVTLINTDGLTIEESNVTYIDGVKVNTAAISAPTAVSAISASQDVETDVRTYEVDTSGGDITLDFNLAIITYTEGQIWYFKKYAAANQLTIQSSGGTIDGAASISTTTQYNTIAIQYDGTNFIII